MPFYRYLGVLEHAVVLRSVPQRIPNVDRAGKAKLVYFTDVLISSVAVAEAALRIGTLAPPPPTLPPAYVAELNLTGCAYTFHGVVSGGTENEYTTPDQPLVITLNPMTLP
jgi:hypothetical protein